MARIQIAIRRTAFPNTPDVAGWIAVEDVKLAAVIVGLLVLAYGNGMPLARTLAVSVGAFSCIGIALAFLGAIGA